MSFGFWVIKYIPTPLERISFTTCSTFDKSALGAWSKSMWASSKKKTIFGFSQSPISGSVSKSSEIIQSIKVAYMTGLWISLWQSRMEIVPLPLQSVHSQSRMSRAGSPKKRSPPSASSATTERMMAARLCFEIFPYSIEKSFAFSPTYCNMERRSFVSISSRF